MSIISQRYANALYELSQEKNSQKEYLDCITGISEICSKDEKLSQLLSDPEYSTEDKIKVTDRIFSEDVPDDIKAFLSLLIKKGRIGLLPAICGDMQKSYDKNNGILEMTVTVSGPSTHDDALRIADKFRDKFKASDVKLTVREDPSVIGGASVLIGDTLYDGTLATKINDLGSALKEC